MNEERLVEELKRDEGMRPYPYRDSLGYWTIGYGHLVSSCKNGACPVWARTGISMEKAEEFLRTDLIKAYAVAGLYLAKQDLSLSDLSERRQRVIVNMAFNLGTKLFQFKKLLLALANSDYETAAREMMNSAWASQVKVRAIRLSCMMREG